MENIILKLIKTLIAEIVPTMNAEATQVVVASTEDGISNNGTTNGVTQQEEPKSANRAVAQETSDSDLINLAANELAAGKRDILISDPTAAVSSLTIACQLLGAHCSELERAKLKDDVERKISNVFQTLRELHRENDNYQQAKEDLQTCLARREQMKHEDSRCRGEVHYQIGVAHGFNMEFDEAIVNLDGSIKELELRIEQLRSKAESVDPTKVGDSFSTREKEIKEIESLIPDIREKIDDIKDMKIETHKRLREKRKMEEGIATNFRLGDGGSLNGDGLSKASSTISSSLIRKRPAVDSAPSDTKKAHIDVEDKE